MSAKRKPDSAVDWSALERDYRAGIKSDRQLEADYGISRGRIKRRADKEGWVRDLTDQINQEANKQLQQSMAVAHRALDQGATPEQRERQIIEFAAATQVELVQRHRGDLALLRGTSMKIAQHLSEQVASGYMEIPGGEGENPIKVPIDLEAAAKTLNNVTGSYQRVVQLERQAFGLDEKESKGNASAEVRTVMQMIMGEPEGLPGESAH